MKKEKPNNSGKKRQSPVQNQLSIDFEEVDYGKHFDPEETEFVKETRKREEEEARERKKNEKSFTERFFENSKFTPEQIRKMAAPYFDDVGYTPIEERDERYISMVAEKYEFLQNSFSNLRHFKKLSHSLRLEINDSLFDFIEELVDITRKHPHEVKYRDVKKVIRIHSKGWEDGRKKEILHMALGLFFEYLWVVEKNDRGRHISEKIFKKLDELREKASEKKERPVNKTVSEKFGSKKKIKTDSKKKKKANRKVKKKNRTK